jgi:hypothetical protein
MCGVCVCECVLERERTVTGKQAEIRTDKARKERIEQEIKDSVDKTKLKRIRKMEETVIESVCMFVCLCV